jgi:hypothetical protein
MSDRHEAFVSSLIAIGQMPAKHAKAKETTKMPMSKPSTSASKTSMQPKLKKRTHKEVDYFDDLNQPSPTDIKKKLPVQHFADLETSEDDDNKEAAKPQPRCLSAAAAAEKLKRPANQTSSRPKPPLSEEELRQAFTEIVKSKVTVDGKSRDQKASVKAGVSKASAAAPQLLRKVERNPGVRSGKEVKSSDSKRTAGKLLDSQGRRSLQPSSGARKGREERGGEKKPNASLKQSSIQSFYPKSQPELLEKRYAGIYGIEPEEEDWDSEDDAFIASDDEGGDNLEDEEEDWREEIKKITRYDPTKFGHIDRGSDRAMEASRKEIEAEERRSRKLAQKEDAEAEREERERLKLKARKKGG